MKTKEQLQYRWSGVLESTNEYLPKSMESYSDPSKNAAGYFTENLCGDFATLARLNYLLYDDANNFRINLKISAGYTIELFEKFEYINQNNPTLFSSFGWLSPLLPMCFSMFKFCFLLDSLASGDMNISKKIANHMGGRPEIENQKNDEFVLSLGYSLKYAVENNRSGVQDWLPRLKKICEDPKYSAKYYLGYYLVLEAIMENDLKKANEAFNQLVLLHKLRCKKKLKDYHFYTYFNDSPDEDLFVWGVGLANLCRYYGLNVVINDPIIPAELINQVENNTFGVN